MALSKSKQELGPEAQWHREKTSSRPEIAHQWSWVARQDSSVLWLYRALRSNEWLVQSSARNRSKAVKSPKNFQASGPYKNSQVIAG